MALTKTKIVNQALQLIGARQITDFSSDDGTPNWDATQLVYDSIRDEVLVEHPWGFAQKRVELVDITKPASASDAWVISTAYELNDRVLDSSIEYVATQDHTSSGTFASELAAGKWTEAHDEDIVFTEDNTSKIYKQPSDLLRLFKVSQLTSYNIANMTIGDSDTNQTVILSATANLKLIYIYQCDDPTLYFSAFVRALVMRLAAELTLYISESNTTQDKLIKAYEEIYLPKAQAIDSQHQGTPEQPQNFEWDAARLNGGGGIFPPFPGAQTWHSVWDGC